MPKNNIVPLSRYEAGYPSDYNASPPAAGSADSEIYHAGTRLRDWARYLAKNSSIIKAVLDARQAKGIGQGLTYEPMIRDRKGNLLTSLNQRVSRLHEEWSKSPHITGEYTRQKIERLVWRDWDTVGEVFTRRIYQGRRSDGLGYKLQLIRSELVPYGFVGENGATMGIERDDFGVPLKYWIYPYARQSNTWKFDLPDYTPKAIPASEMSHIRRQEELDATRGVTLFHAVIFRASDIAEYQQSHRRAARASANLFASINRSMEYDPENAPAISTDAELNLNELQVIDYLGQGESLNFHAAQHPNQNAVDFVNQELRQFSSACRCAFSWVAYVFDRAYAAQRTELVHAWEMIMEDRAQFIEDFAKPVLYDQVLRFAISENRIPTREIRKADPDTLYDVRIDGPVMPSIDPKVDRETAKIEQEQGWESRHGNIRRFGRNPAQVDAEREKDNYQPMTENQSTNDVDTREETDDE